MGKKTKSLCFGCVFSERGELKDDMGSLSVYTVCGYLFEIIL